MPFLRAGQAFFLSTSQKFLIVKAKAASYKLIISFLIINFYNIIKIQEHPIYGRSYIIPPAAVWLHNYISLLIPAADHGAFNNNRAL